MSLDKRGASIALVVQTPPELGGANHYEKSLCEIMVSLCEELGIELCVFAPASLGQTASNWKIIETSPFDNLRILVSRFCKKSKLFRTAFSKQISDLKIDAVYFTSPNKFASDASLPLVISTVWDIGHRELPFMPEMSSWGRWFLREIYFRTSLKNSKFVITDSVVTIKNLQKFFDLPSTKAIAIGLLPANHKIPGGQPLQDGKYFIYPAQKWRHKNHKTIIRAMIKVLEIDSSVKLVFTGSDKGEGKRIQKLVRKLDLEWAIVDLGFVSEHDLLNLEAFATALLMPSLLGPTNIPPLDALRFGTTAIVSDSHEFPSDIQNKLTVVKGRSVKAWSDAMIHALNSDRKPPIVHDLNPAVKKLKVLIRSIVQI